MAPATASPMLTPRQVAESRAVPVDVVYAWIRSGQLLAVDVSASPGGRPRWRIAPADLEVFTANRTNRPTPKPVRRRKAGPAVTEYF
ncbi:MAG: helix-turn-helix domain-containing protein [Planctomycetota bacterium]